MSDTANTLLAGLLSGAVTALALFWTIRTGRRDRRLEVIEDRVADALRAVDDLQHRDLKAAFSTFEELRKDQTFRLLRLHLKTIGSRAAREYPELRLFVLTAIVRFDKLKDPPIPLHIDLLLMLSDLNSGLGEWDHDHDGFRFGDQRDSTADP